MRTCSIAGCDLPHSCRGWCRLHYERWKRQGDPLVVKPFGKFGPPIEERFLRQTRRSESGCLEWIGSLNSMGYGKFFVPGKAHWSEGRNRQVLAHRWAWEHWRGPIPDGVRVLHHCDNPSCVDADHLFLGTQSDNMRDAVAKGRARNQYGIIV